MIELMNRAVKTKPIMTFGIVLAFICLLATDVMAVDRDPVTKIKAEPTPFVRELETGYLLNYSFRAIRAYMWEGKVPLSGWETDDKGGSWDSSPSGLMKNNQFGFHVNWFRLRDTSPQHAVTIKHQIARQKSGKITLEYRFKLPEPMDGASWQLCDLNQPAIAILTKGGDLCYQSVDGSLIALQPYTAKIEYGVKVQVDLDKKKADILVDGKVRASNVSFLNNVRTIDYMLVKTGDQSTGDLYLNPVNIYKGYKLCETFVSSMDGTLPEDWKAAGIGKAVVATIKSSAAPDIFSLKLTGGSADRKLAPIEDKSIFEFCFMTPVRAETLSELQGSQGAILSIATHNDDLCIIDNKGEFVPIVKNYLPNFWYAIKTVVDPAKGTAKIRVNHKKVMDGVALCCSMNSAITGVHFSVKDKTMWVDDIKVYTWRNYPADYVPEPEPVAKKDDTLIGVQSCSLWKEGDAYAGWDYTYPYAEKRKPYLGWYDEGKPEVADWEIKWQVEHGIDFEQYCWYRPNDAVDQPIKSGVLEHGIREGFFNARYSGLKKFTIMYTNQPGAGRTNPDDWKRHLIPYWIEYFFKDPRYLKVDGKPVLAIYHQAKFMQDFGGGEGAAKAISVLREACKVAGFPGIFVLMEDRNGSEYTLQQFKSIGIDYCYAYTWGTGDIKAQMVKMDAQRKVGAKVGLGVIPSFSVGWQTTPWGGGGDGWPSLKDYKALAQWTKDVYMAKMPEGSLGRRMALLPNWNEFSEGHFLMPSALAGFGYIDALRDVFTVGGPHEDIMPTAKQKKRINVMYPKE
jgi:hypothetical protein